MWELTGTENLRTAPREVLRSLVTTAPLSCAEYPSLSVVDSTPAARVNAALIPGIVDPAPGFDEWPGQNSVGCGEFSLGQTHGTAKLG